MSVNVLVYNSIGKILRRVNCPEPMVEMQISEEEDWMLGETDDALNYIVIDDEGIPAIIPRPEQYCVVVGTTLTGFPEGATLLVNGEPHDLTGEVEATLAFELPGDYPVTVTCWPYLDWEGVIHVD